MPTQIHDIARQQNSNSANAAQFVALQILVTCMSMQFNVITLAMMTLATIAFNSNDEIGKDYNCKDDIAKDNNCKDNKFHPRKRITARIAIF